MDGGVLPFSIRSVDRPRYPWSYPWRECEAYIGNECATLSRQDQRDCCGASGPPIHLCW